MWWVYLVRCSDGSLYCGITRDVTRRIAQHNVSRSGAKYTRSRRPVTLVAQWEVPSRSEALRSEFKIKQLTRAQKEVLVSDYSNCADIFRLLTDGDWR